MTNVQPLGQAAALPVHAPATTRQLTLDGLAPHPSHSFMSDCGIVVHSTVPSQEVMMVRMMIPSPHAQHLLYFAHEVLR
jgi:hypothetical protein